MMTHHDANLHAQLVEIPKGFSLADVEIRLAPSAEHMLFDAVMDKHHYLGFRRPVARGLRYIATWQGQWVALAAWQEGSFKCQPRDRWIGWPPDIQFQRLNLIANNTRFLVLAKRGVLPNLASHFLAGMTRQLCDDWLAAHGTPVLIAETFCDPARFSGAMYRSANWHCLGRTKGYARVNGRYSEFHNTPKQIFVHALRRDARRLLAGPDPLPETVVPPSGPDIAARCLDTMRAVYVGMRAVTDHVRARNRKHSLATILAILVFADHANMKGCIAVADFAWSLGQDELAAIGAWKNPRTGQHEPPSKSTVHRVVTSVDPAALGSVAGRYLQERT